MNAYKVTLQRTIEKTAIVVAESFEEAGKAVESYFTAPVLSIELIEGEVITIGEVITMKDQKSSEKQ